MILIFGGTTEGRSAVQVADEAGATYYYSTRGNEQQIVCVNGIRLCGAMQSEEIGLFCEEHDIRLLIDAAHPFAVHIHQNIIEVARSLKIPAIRYERRYPKRNGSIVWCKDYEAAISKLKEQHIQRLLALTGVQTIGKLSNFWQYSDCWFRILHRQESIDSALSEGFPKERLVYYEDTDNTDALIQQIQPDAILTKESGESGGFDKKVEAALKAGISIFAIERPTLPDGFVIVDGKHGLRKIIEQSLPGFFPLKTGYTTGSCATAAAKAALYTLISREQLKQVDWQLPNGEHLSLPLKSTLQTTDSVTCSVIKDAGDDPDITNGLEIKATIRLIHQKETEPQDKPRFIFLGGEGVGTVTLPGLGLSVGDPAINKVPRQMIQENLLVLLKKYGLTNYDVEVTISVPLGRSVAEKTFNPRLGVINGISIIGTSGIVKPFSSEAFISSIQKEMEVALATGTARIVINSGAKSENFLRGYFPELPQQAFVHYGNFIGETLKIAAELDVRCLTMGLMIGKAVKLAEGNLDTHSKKVVMNKSFIGSLAQESGCSASTLQAISKMSLARDLWKLLTKAEMDSFCNILLAHCHRYCDKLLPHGVLDIKLISEEGKILPSS